MRQTRLDIPRLNRSAMLNAAQYWLAPDRFAHSCERLGDRFQVAMPTTPLAGGSARGAAAFSTVDALAFAIMTGGAGRACAERGGIARVAATECLIRGRRARSGVTAGDADRGGRSPPVCATPKRSAERRRPELSRRDNPPQLPTHRHHDVAPSRTIPLGVRTAALEMFRAPGFDVQPPRGG